MNQLIFTSVSKNFEDCLLDWVISLIKIAKYKGEILILNYGIDKSFEEWLRKKYPSINIVNIDLHKEYYLDQIQNIKTYVSWLKETNEVRSLYDNRFLKEVDIEYFLMDSVVNFRYTDVVNYLKKISNDTIIAHFDVDIWFQRSLDDMFVKGESINGALFSNHRHNNIDAAYSKKCLTRLKPFLSSNRSWGDIENKFIKVSRDFNGHINGGFFCGKNKYILEKLKYFKKLMDTKEWFNIRGANQLFLNYTFDYDNDSACNNLYNTMPFRKDKDIIFKNGYWYYGDEIAYAIHNLEYKLLNFKVNHFSTFWKEINQ